MPTATLRNLSNPSTLSDARPRTPEQLHRFVYYVLGIDVAREVFPRDRATLCPATWSAPFDYLTHAFFEAPGKPSADAVVWANRGGGKTMLGAAATLLDMVFKPGVCIRILGGSMEQSQKMYEHLVHLLDRPLLRELCASPPTLRRVELTNGSEVELLSQSHRSVRGTRVHKLRCDEVDEFQPDVWQAAQLVTRSGRTRDGRPIRASIEALSTMHRPFGLMARLTAPDVSLPDGLARGAEPTTFMPAVFRWSCLDVIERCPSERDCQTCPLWDDCQGMAKRASGFMLIDDLIQQRMRSDAATWSAEMLCERPRRSDNVYPMFDVARHVKAWSRDTQHADAATFIGGVDFGLRSPLVMLWAAVEGGGSAARVHVFDEYVATDRTIDQHIAHIQQRDWPRPDWLGVDPAGHQRSSHTGMSDVQLFKRHGFRIRARRSDITSGIRIVRRRLEDGTLHIDPRCIRLSEAMTAYHFDPDQPHNDHPVKDGPDHACDALRYMLVNLESEVGVKVRRY